MSSKTSSIFLSVLLASAAGSALTASASAHAAGYDAETVAMAPAPRTPVMTTVYEQPKIQTPPQATPVMYVPGRYSVPEEPTSDEDIMMASAGPRGIAPPATVVPPMPPYVEIPTDEVPATMLPEPQVQSTEQKSPVGYEADTVDYDQNQRIITLTGNVELTQDGRVINADKIVYRLKDDHATAEGHVEIHETTGDVHYADKVILSDRMRQGLVDRMRIVMADDSRIWADKGVKESEARYVLKNAGYTACKPCEKHPEKKPPWQLRARQVEMRRDEQRVVYKNAWLDMFGVPVLYTPYFSHPDGTVTQKSGFLTPSFGWNSEFGGFFDMPYYWAIDPSTDATVSIVPMTKQSPLFKGQFRKRFENAHLETELSLTNSQRTDSIGNRGVETNDEVRGHLISNGGWDINEYWRGTLDLNVASDEQYMRQYGFSNESVLENRIAAERFENRDYVLIEALAFQDVRAGAAKSDQPNILPYAQVSMMGDPNAVLGGRWSWDASALALARDGSGQDVWRGSTELSWQRQDIAPFGLVFTTDAALRGDAYATTNRIEAALNPLEEENKQQGRFFPSAQFTAAYPLQSTAQRYQLRVEPVATLYLSPDVENDSSIPNEDSQDVQLDAGNLMEGNRFPGYDRIEDGSHVAYGLRSGIYTDAGGQFSTFVGQSYSFDNEDNPFPVGSGLETQSSDYVGAVTMSFDEGRHSLDYRVQVDSNSLTSRRHELFGRTYYGPVSLDAQYLYAKGQPGTTYADSREQIRLGSTVDFSEQWSLRGDGIYDLSSLDTERGLRRAIGTLMYEHECYNLALTADRQLANATSGVQDTTVMFRIGLKNLGEYETKAFAVGSGAQSAD